MDVPEHRLAARVSAEIVGLPADFVDTYAARIDALTPAAVNAAIKRRVHARDLAITMVATASVMKKLLVDAKVQESAIDVVPYDSVLRRRVPMRQGVTASRGWSAQGRYLTFIDDDGWEYVTRPDVTGVVVIVAITADGGWCSSSSTGPPVHKRVIELPAGLVGDVEGQRAESMADAAARELEEETGYARRARWSCWSRVRSRSASATRRSRSSTRAA